MRRQLIPGIVLVSGLLILLDLLVVNPSLEAASGAVDELVVLLAAAAAVGGGATLAAHHVRQLAAGQGDRAGSAAVLVGMGAMLVAGLRPGSAGSRDPVVLWLVAALLVPIAASLFALLFFFLLLVIIFCNCELFEDSCSLLFFFLLLVILFCSGCGEGCD